ncbi:MAG: hypothetical protein QM736_07790 [Vicinamibacterales bacterium]
MAQAGRAAAVAIVSAIGFHVLGFAPLAGPGVPPLTLSTVLALITLSTFFDLPRDDADYSVSMRVSFVGEVVTLLYFGTFPMTIVAIAGAAARAIAHPARTHRARSIGVAVLTAAAAAQAAGAVYDVVASQGTPVVWPWQVLPLAAAVFAYTTVLGSVADLVAPRAFGRPASYRWPADSLRGFPSHIVGASVAAGLIRARSPSGLDDAACGGGAAVLHVVRLLLARSSVRRRSGVGWT